MLDVFALSTALILNWQAYMSVKLGNIMQTY